MDMHLSEISKSRILNMSIASSKMYTGYSSSDMTC